MLADVTKKLFTVDDYYRMADAGILNPRDRVELIEGEIVEMSPIGLKHVSRLIRANEFFTFAFKGRAFVSIQLPLRLNNYNEPQPDIVIMRTREDYYEAKRLTPEDTFLVIEVSDSSLRYDQKVKLPLYAATGVVEFWIENLQDNVLLVCRDPEGKDYKTQFTLRSGDSVSPLSFPGISFKVSDLLG